MIFFALCLSPSALSQIPQGFNYQAIARDGTGNPISDQLNVRIAILSDDEPETVLWEEQHDGVDPDDRGLFSIIVGTGTWHDGLENFSDIDWTVIPKFIRTQIYYGSEWKNMGSAQLWSVPYSLHSESSDQWKTTGGNIYRETGNVGINTTTPAAALDVNGESIFRASIAPDWIEMNRYSTGNRYSGIDFHGDDTYTDFSLRILRKNTGADAYSRIWHRGLGSLQILTNEAAPIDLLTAGAYRLRVASDGKVGIGTTAPTGRLQVEGGTAWPDEDPFFAVKNKWGIPVLAVYNNGVRILVDNTDEGKAVKGGFAIGGYDYTKAGSTVDFMRVTPDSIRFNINNSPTKSVKGGFAIGGYGNTKGPINEDFMYITPQQSTVGQFNTFLGYLAGVNNTNGTFNTFFGYEAGLSTTGDGGGESGSHNVFIGYRSGYLNTNGYNNIYIGYEAGYTSTNAGANICIGYQSGKSATGNGSVFLGQLTGEKSTGSNNTFIGTQTGRNTTGGYQNTFMGSPAGYNNQGGIRNTYLGFQAGNGNTSGNNNVAVGYQAGIGITTGSNNIAIGNNAQVPTATASNQIRMGNTSIASASIQVAWTVTSDIRWKESIADLHLGLSFVNKLKPVDYIRKNNESGKREAGFIAQDIEKLFEEMGITDAGLLTRGYEGFLELRYNDFIPILTKAIQEQQEQIESQQSQIDELKEMINEMEVKFASSR